MNKQFIIGKEYFIEWEDHFSDDSWMSLEEIAKWAEASKTRCTAQGIVTYQDSNVVVLSSVYDGENNYANHMAVLKRDIKKKRRQ